MHGTEVFFAKIGKSEHVKQEVSYGYVYFQVQKEDLLLITVITLLHSLFITAARIKTYCGWWLLSQNISLGFLRMKRNFAFVM